MNDTSSVVPKDYRATKFPRLTADTQISLRYPHTKRQIAHKFSIFPSSRCIAIEQIKLNLFYPRTSSRQ